MINSVNAQVMIAKGGQRTSGHVKLTLPMLVACLLKSGPP